MTFEIINKIDKLISLLEQQKKSLDRVNPNLFKLTDQLELSVRAHNYFDNNKIEYVHQLCTLTREQIKKTPMIGNKTVNEMQDCLSDLGLCFGMRINLSGEAYDIRPR